MKNDLSSAPISAQHSYKSDVVGVKLATLKTEYDLLDAPWVLIQKTSLALLSALWLQ